MMVMVDSLWKRLLHFSIVGTLLTVVFVGIYGGLGWRASEMSNLLHLYGDWELAIPFVPGFIYIYCSLNLLLTLPPFCLKVSEIWDLGLILILATVLAGVVFFVFPTDLGFERHASVVDHFLFSVIYSLDTPHNLVPSLHVTYTTITVGFLSPRVSGLLRLFLWLWWGLMSLAVVFVHQHHILDVVTGWGLGFLCIHRNLVYKVAEIREFCTPNR